MRRLFLWVTASRRRKKMDDYKGYDLKGKVALLFVNEPFPMTPAFSREGANVQRALDL